MSSPWSNEPIDRGLDFSPMEALAAELKLLAIQRIVDELLPAVLQLGLDGPAPRVIRVAMLCSDAAVTLNHRTGSDPNDQRAHAAAAISIAAELATRLSDLQRSVTV